MTDRGEDVVTILVAGCARGGEVLAADVVRQLAGTVPGLPLHPRGEVTLKGFPERVRLHEVVWRKEVPSAPATTAAQEVTVEVGGAGPLLPLPPGPRPSGPGLGPRRIPAAELSVLVTAEGILRVLRLLAGATATVLLLEDLHWADPESLASGHGHPRGPLRHPVRPPGGGVLDRPAGRAARLSPTPPISKIPPLTAAGGPTVAQSVSSDLS